MKPFLGVLLVFACWLSLAAAEDPLPKPLVVGLPRTTSIVVGMDRKIYFSKIGDDKKGHIFQRDADGKKLTIITSDLEHPTAMVARLDSLFVADGTSVKRIDRRGKASNVAAANAFPAPPQSLYGIAVDEQGTIYVTDQGDGKAKGAIYRIPAFGRVSLVTDGEKSPAISSPRSVVMDGMSNLLVVDSGDLLRVKIADGSTIKIADGVGSGSGMTWDRHGRLYIADGKRLLVIAKPGAEPVVCASGFENLSGLCIDPSMKSVLAVDEKAGTITPIPTKVPGLDIDETPLALEAAVAFPDLQWSGWEPESANGRPSPLRPILLTHAGDGTNRIFVPTEQGVIHVFPNDQKATKTQVFLDLRDRVVYDDRQNEEGFLGLAFHPNYKTNGEFFVFYTLRKAKLTNIVSRFRVSKNNSNMADPASEEVLMRIEKPYWNHDGGTLCFGPDGYLYITHGDGGLGNDPHGNGQSLKNFLGKVLRIDVDHKDPGKNYAIPKDNPFVDQKDVAGEIWAYGLRNIWRMSFDRKTGVLWAGDVGQNLYEEIDLIVKGGNYGWSVREGQHPFGPNGAGLRKDLVEPIWEYDHDLGKCIIGGNVYRGSRLPELEGYYLYADYVTSNVWALRYDEAKKRVVANRRLNVSNIAVLSFGEDEKGEVYFVKETPTGKGIYWFVKK